MDIVVAPILLNNTKLTIGADDYEATVSSVAIVPNTTVVTFTGMTPTAVHNFADSQWRVEIDHAQDLATANSLTQYLLANQGVAKEITFRPVAGGKGWKVTAVCVPSQLGGAGRQVASSRVSLPVNGAPEEVAAPA